jgi:hypothetical protein
MKSGREEIIRILMKRDKLSYMEAFAQYNEGMKAVHRALLDGDDVEAVFCEEFGLEPDYLFDVLA